MKEALKDPKRVKLFDILPPRSGYDKTGLGAGNMQGMGSISSSFVKGVSLADEQPTQVEDDQSSTSKGLASPHHAYPDWAHLQTLDNKARQEDIGWAWMRFQDTSFLAQNLTDFMEIRTVTTEIQYLARHWIRNHHKRQKEQEPP